MLGSASDISTVLPRYLDFIGDSIVVAHNANFDVNFLYDYAERLRRTFYNDFVDTMRISRRIYKEIPNHKLGTLSVFLQVENQKAHRALSDCYCANDCYQKMNQHVKKEKIDISLSQKSTSRPAKTITTKNTEFDEESPVFGMTFVFTGKLDRITRESAMQFVVDAGGSCKDSITSTTNYLVLGSLAYCKTIKGGKSSKQKKAEKMQLSGHPISVISEDIFCDMLQLCEIETI